MTIGTWFAEEEAKVGAWFTNEEAQLIQFFGPLFKQIIAAGEALGKQTIQQGVQVILDAATKAVTTAASAPAGSNIVQVAEQTFLATAQSEGVIVIHNAEAGAIKAAVAIAQSVSTTDGAS